MTRILYGDRIGRTAMLRIGCSAIIFNRSKEKILLIRRTDNGQWCLPGGGIDPGESVTEACVREVLEETGLRVKVSRLIGVYSNPHQLIEYGDGSRYQIIGLNFEVEVIGGELIISDETTDFGYFSFAETQEIDLMEHHRERIADAIMNQAVPFIR